MAEYLFYKKERYWPEGGDHVKIQSKYICECSEPEKTKHIHPLCGMGHPLTRDNFHTLVGQVASIIEHGDTIETIEKPQITAGGNTDEEKYSFVELRLPLNETELRILASQVLEALRNK